MEFPGQIDGGFLCHTFNEFQWFEAELIYKQNNNNYGVCIVSQEDLYNNLSALHLLIKLDNGAFERKLICINRDYLNHYKMIQ